MSMSVLLTLGRRDSASSPHRKTIDCTIATHWTGRVHRPNYVEFKYDQVKYSFDMAVKMTDEQLNIP